MDAVDFDPVAGNVSGSKKGKSLEVIPMEMRKKDIIDVPRIGCRLPEISKTRPGVAKDIFIPAADLDTGTVSSVGAPDGEGEFPVHKSFQGTVIFEGFSLGSPEGLDDLLSNLFSIQG
jgi:hypothetical protein